MIKRAGDVLRKNIDKHARLMTEEMGKPVAQSRSEVEKCAWVCDYFAENGEEFLRDTMIESDASKSFVTFQPIGVVLAVMPWNFPYWQVFRFAVPGLMAGNGYRLCTGY
jgi:succinate-semialdehyde dehydrogenase/glutarate-semialdehyde dehydrogenase